MELNDVSTKELVEELSRRSKALVVGYMMPGDSQMEAYVYGKPSNVVRIIDVVTKKLGEIIEGWE